MVGHVDFKFVLNSNITNIPQIQVTLLKNKAPGLGKVNGKKACKISLKTLVFFLLKLLILCEVCWKMWLKLCKYFHFLFLQLYFSGACSFFHLTCSKVNWENKLDKQFQNTEFSTCKSAQFKKVEQVVFLYCLNPPVIKINMLSIVIHCRNRQLKQALLFFKYILAKKLKEIIVLAH